MDKLVRAKQARLYELRGKSVSYGEAYSEVVADSMEAMLADGNVLEKLMELKAKDNGLVMKMKQFFDNLLNKIRSVYKGLTPDSAEGKAVLEMTDSVEKLQQLFAEALVEASENFQTAEKNTTQESGVMYMSREIEEVTEDTVREDLTDVFNGNNVTSKSYIPLSKTTPFAVRYITGYMANRPIIVDKKKAYFDMREYGKFKEDKGHHYHGMGIDGFLNALVILDDPEFAILEDMGDGQYHYAFISSNENGEELCVVFQMNVTKTVGQMNGYPGGYYNLDITEFVATDEWLEEHGVEPGTSYKDYLLSFSENSIAYDRSIHLEQLEKARKIDSESAGLAASYVNNRASEDNLTQPGTVVKNETVEVMEEDIKRSDRDYSYEGLISKPDMKVTTLGGNVPKNRADVIVLAKQNAAKVGKFDPKTGSVRVHVEDIDRDVVLGTSGLKHSLDRRMDVNAPVTLMAGEILQNSIQINELTPQKAESEESYVLIGAARDGSGDLFVVRSVVNRFSNELTSMDVLYAINAKKGNRLRSMRPGFQGPVTDSTISIAELLDYVNEYFPDILPEGVLKHYGYDSRPEGKLGDDVLYQDRDTESVSNRSLLANAMEALAQSEIERNKIREYRGKIDRINAEEQKLQRLNEQIRELSFAKGPRDKAKLSALRDEATKTANRINIYDRQILRLEASKPLQDVLEREKKKAYQKAREKSEEARKAHRDRALKSNVRTRS